MPELKPLSRSSIEAYAFGFLGFLLVVVPMNTYFAGTLWFVMAGLAGDVVWRSPLSIQWPTIRKGAVAALVIAIVLAGGFFNIRSRVRDVQTPQLAQVDSAKIATEVADRLRKEPIVAPTPAPAALDLDTDKVFAAVTPQELIGIYRSKLTYQAEPAVAIYYGKWMRLSVRLQNITSPHPNELWLIGRYEWASDWAFATCEFDKATYEARLSQLQPKQKMTMLGKLKKANGGGVDLEACELR